MSKTKIKKKERTTPTFDMLNIGDVFRDEYGIVYMKVDDYDAKIHGGTGKLYELNAVSLKNAELCLFDDNSVVYPMKVTFVEE